MGLALLDGTYVVRTIAHQTMGMGAGLVIRTQHGLVTEWALLGDYAAGLESWTSAKADEVTQLVIGAYAFDDYALIHRV